MENTKESKQSSIQLQLLPYNLGGLNHSPCYRTAIQKQHTPHHISTASRWSLKELATATPHSLYVCPLYLLALSQCPASYFERQQLWWQKPPLIPLSISAPQFSTTLTGKHSAHMLTRVGERRSDEKDGRKQGLVTTLELLNSQSLPVASNTA